MTKEEQDREIFKIRISPALYDEDETEKIKEKIAEDLFTASKYQKKRSKKK